MQTQLENRRARSSFTCSLREWFQFAGILRVGSYMVRGAYVKYGLKRRRRRRHLLHARSEITPEGKRITKLEQILLNGNNVALVSA